MNAEQIKAAREALDNMADYARMNTGVGATGSRKVLEDFITEAERATQPAQDSLHRSLDSLAMALWRTHYRESSPEFELLPDAAGVLSQISNMATGLVRAAPQDQVAAVRAVLSDVDVAKICVAVRPDEFTDNDGIVDYLRYDAAVIRAWLSTPTPQAAATDDPIEYEWKMLLDDKGQYRPTPIFPGLPPGSYAAARSPQPDLTAEKFPPSELTWLYTHCRAIGMDCKSGSGKWENDICLWTINLTNEIKQLRQRATDAEAKLAAIREGVEKLAWVYEHSVNDRKREAVWRDDVLALLAQRTSTPSQGDTSGLPG